MLEIMLLFCHGLWELGVRRNCLSLTSKTNSVISWSLFLMPGIELKPQHLVRKWLWPDLCLKISLFGCKRIWRNACESLRVLCNTMRRRQSVMAPTLFLVSTPAVSCVVWNLSSTHWALRGSGACTAEGKTGIWRGRGADQGDKVFTEEFLVSSSIPDIDEEQWLIDPFVHPYHCKPRAIRPRPSICNHIFPKYIGAIILGKVRWRLQKSHKISIVAWAIITVRLCDIPAPDGEEIKALPLWSFPVLRLTERQNKRVWFPCLCWQSRGSRHTFKCWCWN